MYKMFRLNLDREKVNIDLLCQLYVKIWIRHYRIFIKKKILIEKILIIDNTLII